MTSLFHSFLFLSLPDELNRAIALGMAVIAAAIFYRFFENIFDVMGAGGRVRRFFIAEWGQFEDRLEELKIESRLRQLLRSWALENHPHQPMEVLDNRLYFETWVSQLTQRPGFESHSQSAVWRKQMRALRVAQKLFPGVEDQVLSSREIREGTVLHVTKTHPDLEAAEAVETQSIQIESVDDLAITGRLSDEDGSLRRGEYWCRFHHDGDQYRFQAKLLSSQAGLVALEHGRFIIREKRGDQRVPYQRALTVHWTDGDESRAMTVESLDLSRSGLALASESLIPLKTRLTLSLPLPGSPGLQSVDAEILDVTPFSQGLVRLHCHFLDLEKNELKSLEDFVRKIRKSETSNDEG